MKTTISYVPVVRLWKAQQISDHHVDFMSDKNILARNLDITRCRTLGLAFICLSQFINSHRDQFMKAHRMTILEHPSGGSLTTVTRALCKSDALNSLSTRTVPVHSDNRLRSTARVFIVPASRQAFGKSKERREQLCKEATKMRHKNHDNIGGPRPAY